MCESVREAVY